MRMFDLTGQRAIVTGAATRIGEAIATRLNRAGARIVVADMNLLDAEAVAEQLEHDSFAAYVDVTKPDTITAMSEKVLAQCGSLEVLVNNAGIAGPAGPIWKQSDEAWMRAIAVNLSGVFFFCRAVLPHLRARRYGRIVNIASIAGKEGNAGMVPTQRPRPV
jgi:2-dehydro-3-deoxy-L-rhamnonate dehydrogenase (NAD+)